MEAYLEKAALRDILIEDHPHNELSVVVVIPAYREKHLKDVLIDLYNCEQSEGAVEIIIVINQAEGSGPDAIAINQESYNECLDWIDSHQSDGKRFYLIYEHALPDKKAGVGVARKIGMDEAVRRFLEVDNPKGVIVCLDADCRVSLTYLKRIEEFFRLNPNIEGCSIGFSHPLDSLPPDHREAIAGYETHLRYFIAIQRWAGYPFAYQTIGSAMAVRAEVYCKVGGMNLRKAGEDFYFLHKVIERGAFADLEDILVYPSPRVSDRVPFGTGRAMLETLHDGKQLDTYHPRSFADLRKFLQIVPMFYQATESQVKYLLDHCLPATIRSFLLTQDFYSRAEECNAHTSTPEAFTKRLLRWFNAFLLMKYVHFARDNFYSNIEVKNARHYS